MNILDFMPAWLGDMLLAVELIGGLYLAVRYWERVRVLVPGRHAPAVICLNAAALAFCGVAALDTLTHTVDPATAFGLLFAWAGLHVTAPAWVGGMPPRHAHSRPAEFDEAPHHHA